MYACFKVKHGEPGQIPSAKKRVEELWDKRKILNVFDVHRQFISPVHSKLRKYLNSPDVRAAIRIPMNVQPWEDCRKLRYLRGHYVYAEAKKIIVNKFRVLLYYGDTDAVVSFLNRQKFLSAMGLKQKEQRKPWIYARELAGFVANYEDDVTFVTFRGVGHIVPLWAPAQAQYVIRRFIENLTIGVTNCVHS
ncbi:Protein F41C3.5 [Aphelenchoides avenae]|nr:Protein F41C3.5 [Aphelenchus avenae]